MMRCHRQIRQRRIGISDYCRVRRTARRDDYVSHLKAWVAEKDKRARGYMKSYSGDVWYPQPAPKDHPWRYMPNQAMTPHISGTTIDAQLRYAAGVKDMLDSYFKGEEFPAQNYIVKEGKLASQNQ